MHGGLLWSFQAALVFEEYLRSIADAVSLEFSSEFFWNFELSRIKQFHCKVFNFWFTVHGGLLWSFQAALVFEDSLIADALSLEFSIY